MTIHEATRDYERWLGRHVTLLQADLVSKHEAMRADPFQFLRATFYRWIQVFPEVCPEEWTAHTVLALGDLHIENFGSWRDGEGRLVWGVNDFDEAFPLPYTNDLVRLATSARLAAGTAAIATRPRPAAKAIERGYRKGVEAGGMPFVLAEHHDVLRKLVVDRLRDPERFWKKLDELEDARSVPTPARAALLCLMPGGVERPRTVHRVSGLGSLGRERFTMLGFLQGSRVAREIKPLAPSACAWALGGTKGAAAGSPYYPEILRRAVRCGDPFLTVEAGWVGRRLAPDLTRIDLASLPAKSIQEEVLEAMGFETANVHLGSASTAELRADLRRRDKGWLDDAAERMAAAVEKDWKAWRRKG